MCCFTTVVSAGNLIISGVSQVVINDGQTSSGGTSGSNGCMANCKDCSTGAGSCDECDLGYLSVTVTPEAGGTGENYCASCSGSLLTPMIGENCLDCYHTQTNVHCQTCSDGYFRQFTGDFYMCTRCDSAEAMEVQDPLCETCSPTNSVFKAVCDTCKTGSTMQNGKCVADNTGVCKAVNCKSCASDADSCDECDIGYSIASVTSGDGTVTVNYCTSCEVSNCADCTSGPELCDACAEGYMLDSDENDQTYCAAQTTVAPTTTVTETVTEETQQKENTGTTTEETNQETNVNSETPTTVAVTYPAEAEEKDTTSTTRATAGTTQKSTVISNKPSVPPLPSVTNDDDNTDGEDTTTSTRTTAAPKTGMTALDDDTSGNKVSSDIRAAVGVCAAAIVTLCVM